jgi:hypothetical protein
MKTGIMTAAPSRSIAPGTVAIFRGAQLVYAGPIEKAPSADGRQVLINAVDYEEFKQAFIRSEGTT